MPKQIPLIRIFLSSPGDVSEERVITRNVIEQLQYDPLLREQIILEIIGWDVDRAGVPLLATMTPQEAINSGLPRPSECDIVIVIFWSRMGTPLPFPEYQKPDGTRYQSGTDWEFYDAVQAERKNGKPITLVYRRTERILLSPDDLDFDNKVAQYRHVGEFFDGFRDPTTGALTGGYNEYKAPEDFSQKLRNHLRALIPQNMDLFTSEVSTGNLQSQGLEAAPMWKGSPYPGLRSFSEVDAPIFFGRGQDVDGVIQRLRDSRFLAVVGATGVGKSSLIKAGVVPRLRANAIDGSKNWCYVVFSPGQLGNPFTALFSALLTAFPHHSSSAFLSRDEEQAFEEEMVSDPNNLSTVIDSLMNEAHLPLWAETLFFIDQFEELFTLVHTETRNSFIESIIQLSLFPRARVLLGLRANYYPECLPYPGLAQLLSEGVFSLGSLDAIGISEAITRPAERAGIKFDIVIPGRIIQDIGSEPGALPLLAYLLDELYQLRTDDNRITYEIYERIGGVGGAIGNRAEQVFANLTPDVQAALPRLFRDLVSVDEQGRATRQRARLSEIGRTLEVQSLLRAFTEARLLVTEAEYIEISHDALFRAWSRLANWIANAQEDLRLLRRLRDAVNDWEQSGRRDDFLWPDTRLLPVYEMIQRLEPNLTSSERYFIRPESDRLIEKLNDTTLTAFNRSTIGEQLSVIGDPRRGVGIDKQELPEFEWCEGLVVDTTEISVAGRIEVIKPFSIAKYPVTYVQFDTFVQSYDGYTNSRWWSGLEVEPSPEEQFFRYKSNPRDSVSWFEAVAFCRWLTDQNSRLSKYPGKVIRLPTEAEWYLAAQPNVPASYTWGDTWMIGHANTRESRLRRTVAVGLYPFAASTNGAMDMCGNVWEWTLTNFETYSNEFDGEGERVLRGGSWQDSRVSARITTRWWRDPSYRSNHVGFRVSLAEDVKP